ncbi:MAG TPA: hypothetical protein VFZ99_08175 [Terriglobales bacterium]
MTVDPNLFAASEFTWHQQQDFNLGVATGPARALKKKSVLA